jgi:hypothetical protein
MEDWVKELVPLGQLTGIGVLSIIAWLVITRKLVWHTDLETFKTESAGELKGVKEERDEWKRITLQLLGVTEKLTVQAEVTNEVMSRLPSSPDTGK